MLPDDEAPWYRTLLVSVGAMLGVALVVGALVGGVVLGAVKVTGLGEQRVAVEEEPTLVLPERTPGEETEDDGGPTLEDLTGIPADKDKDKDKSGGDGGERSAQDEKKKKQRKKRSVISLSASPAKVAPMQRIDLTGTYPRGEGATLQVQRFDGGWSSFADVTATVRGQTFATYIMTGRTGMNRFRVVDPSSGKSSNPVRVRVG